MITGLSESKTLVKHASCDCRCKLKIKNATQNKKKTKISVNMNAKNHRDKIYVSGSCHDFFKKL